MIKQQQFNEDEIFSYLASKIFSENNFEIFPQLEESFNENPNVMINLLYEFVEDLYDLSKPVVRPLLDDRSTYIYRKALGIFDNGYLQTRISIGKEFNMTGVRIGQLIKHDNIILINWMISEYNNIKNNIISHETLIEELGLPNAIYFKLKRQGINYLHEIDFESLKDVKGFGDTTLSIIEKGISRIRK